MTHIKTEPSEPHDNGARGHPSQINHSSTGHERYQPAQIEETEEGIVALEDTYGDGEGYDCNYEENYINTKTVMPASNIGGQAASAG